MFRRRLGGLVLVPLLIGAIMVASGCELPTPTAAPLEALPTATSPAPAERQPTAIIESTATLKPSTPTKAAPTPTSTQPAKESTLTPSAASQFVEGKVIDVVDGDTIKVELGGEIYTVRYIGIDTPETVHPSKPIECYGKEAATRNKDLVGSKVVELEKDVSETDKYDRLLRYVYVDGLFVNAELVKQGYAQASTYPPDVKYQELFLKLQQEARDSQRGLWNPANCPEASPIGSPTTSVIMPSPTATLLPAPMISPSPTAPPKPATATPVVPPIVTPIRECCKVCKTGKACGDSCISKDAVCTKPPGCACDAP